MGASYNTIDMSQVAKAVKMNLASLVKQDWADLWRPELAGKIAMVDSSREIVSAVLKYMGASYNTIDMSEVPGGREAVQQNPASLVKQVRLFDSRHYLKAFGIGDIWVAVGWSNDVLPAAKRLSNIAVIVLKSGASLWADCWDFLRSQGKRVKLRSEFRQSLQDIFHELCTPLQKGKINPKSALAADVVTLGDTWLSHAIEKKLIEPINGLEDQDWFENLNEKWKVYLRRSDEGKLDSSGRIWAAPYRWGSVVIAYKKSEFQKRKMAPIEDWADLWRPELAGKIAMVDSPREIVGAVLKYMGASYNTTDMSEVAGGREAVQQNLASLVKQVRLFDSRHYLKAFGVGDVWVAVGWSNDVVPAAKRLSNVAVIVPKSGASLWADCWAIPAASRIATDQIGGRVRGPSPVVHQWIEFCLQAERFKDDVVPGASPNTLESPVKVSEELTRGRPKLETNLIAGVPPSDILAKCELIEPLPEKTLSDYRWLINSVQKKESSLAERLRNRILSLAHRFLPKVQSKVA